MFIPGTKIDLVLSSAYKRYDKLDGSIDLSVGIQYLSQSIGKMNLAQTLNQL